MADPHRESPCEVDCYASRNFVQSSNWKGSIACQCVWCVCVHACERCVCVHVCECVCVCGTQSLAHGPHSTVSSVCVVVSVVHDRQHMLCNTILYSHQNSTRYTTHTTPLVARVYWIYRPLARATTDLKSQEILYHNLRRQPSCYRGSTFTVPLFYC